MRTYYFVEAFALLFMVWAAIAVIDRVVWVNAGDGIAGVVGPLGIEQSGAEICDPEEIAEVKWQGERLVYRCGHTPLWPKAMWRSGHSSELEEWWERTSRRIAAGNSSTNERKLDDSP
jgi:hypothetical protein